MSCGEPIANRVLGVDTGKEDHPVYVLPVISQLGLQHQFIAHRHKPHDLVGGLLFFIHQQLQRGCGCKISKSHICEEWPLGEVNAQNHVQHGSGCVDLQSAHYANLQACHLVSK